MWTRFCVALLIFLSTSAFFHGSGGPGSVPPTNVIAVSLGGSIHGENVVPNSPAGTPIDDLSATVTGGGPCTTCTWTMATTGVPTGQSGPGCTTASNNFQVVNFGSGQAHLQVLNSALAPQVFGAPPYPGSGTGTFVCVVATPASGTPFTFLFSIIVRGNVMTEVDPLTVNYPNPTSSGTHIATMHTTVVGTPGTQTVTLSGTDTMCGNLTVSGNDIVANTNLTTQRGICHVTVAQTGVTCPIFGAITATPATCVAAVMFEPAPYIGPGDCCYANGAPGLTWTRFNEAYGYSAAYCASGTNTIWTVVRERDQAFFRANCLPNGDMDLAGLANFCKDSVCYMADQPAGTNASVDQSGGSPNNDFHARADILGGGNPPLVQWRPAVIFNAADGVVPMMSASNATDRFLQDPNNYTGTGSTGIIEAVAQTTGATALATQLVPFNAVNTSSSNETILGFSKVGGLGADLYNGPDNQNLGTVCSVGPAVANVPHGVIGVVNGTSGQISVDGGTPTPCTFTQTPILQKPTHQYGGYGGGSLTGLGLGSAVSPIGTPSVQQLAALYCFEYQHAGVGSGTGC